MGLKSIYTDVAKATVVILKKGGQGVLVNNNLIITAAHCIDYGCNGEMVLGEYYIEEIKAGGRELKVTPLAVEPVSDIAVLGSLDDQEFGNEANDFKKFCEHTRPVPLCRSEFEPFREFRVHIRTHKKTWVTGSAMKCRDDAAVLQVKSNEPIVGGTSGGPIINDSGELVGIVSNFNLVNEVNPESEGIAPRPHLTLPVWLCHRIFC